MDTWILISIVLLIIVIAVGGFFAYRWYKNRQTSTSQCKSSNDCDVDNICVSGKCVIGCNTNSDCKSTEICNTKTNRCTTGCRKDTDCPSSYTCDISSGQCQATGVECKVSSDCKTSPLTQCYNGTCVQCLLDTDCENNQVCSSTHQCIVKVQCTSSNDCNGKLCVNGQCTDCSVDGDCIIGDICSNGKCIVGCGSDDSRCPTGQICINGNCINGCHTDGQCQHDQICSNSTCITGCRVDSQCIAGSKCINSICIANGCVNNSDCPSGQVCGNDNTCTTPLPTTDCDPSLPNYPAPIIDGKTIYTIANLNSGLVMSGFALNGAELFPLNCTDATQQQILQPTNDEDGSFYITISISGVIAYLSLTGNPGYDPDIKNASKFIYQRCGLLTTSDKQYILFSVLNGKFNIVNKELFTTSNWKGNKNYLWVFSSTSC